MSFDYDLLVIGSGPAGQKAAIQAAKLGQRGRRSSSGGDMVGGVCINTGTIPSKTLREAVLYLTGLSQRELYGASYRVKDDITIDDLSARTQHVIAREIDVIRDQLHAQPRPRCTSATAASSTRTPSRVRRRRRQRGAAHRGERSSSPSAPTRRGPPTSSSTSARCSTPTASSGSAKIPRRWWSSAPA